jgi:hypothetical protein
MYLRNVKQILRAADPGFDERRYGFGGLMDLLRACQKEGLIRLERDRRGGLRVFQGAALQRAAAPDAIVDVAQADVMEIQPGGAADRYEGIDAEPSVIEPIPIDTTAELLGRAKPRRPRSRVAAAAQPPARPARKVAARKPAGRRAGRSKKAAAAEANDDPTNKG